MIATTAGASAIAATAPIASVGHARFATDAHAVVCAALRSVIVASAAAKEQCRKHAYADLAMGVAAASATANAVPARATDANASGSQPLHRFHRHRAAIVGPATDAWAAIANASIVAIIAISAPVLKCHLTVAVTRAQTAAGARVPASVVANATAACVYLYLRSQWHAAVQQNGSPKGSTKKENPVSRSVAHENPRITNGQVFAAAAHALTAEAVAVIARAASIATAAIATAAHQTANAIRANAARAAAAIAEAASTSARDAVARNSPAIRVSRWPIGSWIWA